MSKTKFNENIEEILNEITPVTSDQMDRVHELIGEDTNVYHAIINNEWLEQQYIGDGKEFCHSRYGTVIITVEVTIVDIIDNNALVQNKHIYKSKYRNDTHEVSVFFFGPISKELINELMEEAD